MNENKSRLFNLKFDLMKNYKFYFSHNNANKLYQKFKSIKRQNNSKNKIKLKNKFIFKKKQIKVRFFNNF